MIKPGLTYFAILSAFASFETSFIDQLNWQPRCQFGSELCDPTEKPVTERGKGTLINTIGVGASTSLEELSTPALYNVRTTQFTVRGWNDSTSS